MRYIFDLETNGLLPEVSLIHCLVMKDATTGDIFRYNHQSGTPGRSGSIEEGLRRLADAHLLVGHNIICYDLPVIRKLYPEFRWDGEVCDTLTAASMLWPADALRGMDFGRNRRTGGGFPGNLIGRQSLEAWGWRLGIHKGAFSKTTDWKNWSLDMEEYCVQDVYVTQALFDRIQAKNPSPQAMRIEHRFQAIVFQQEQTGVPFDTEAATALYAELAGQRDALRSSLQAIFPGRTETLKQPQWYTIEGDPKGEKAPTKGALHGRCRELKALKGGTIKSWADRIVAGPPITRDVPFNPGSAADVAEGLKDKYGWAAVERTETGQPSITEAVLKTIPHPEAADILKYLSLQKMLGQLGEGNKAWLRFVGADGRIHGRVHTNRAITGRCSHSHPNLAQVPRVAGKLRGYEGGWGWESRSLFAAPPGKIMVGADASGLELRCLGHYMARYDDGAYVKALLEGDIHTVNQEATGLPTRDNAKTFIYGFLYGAGPWKLGCIVGASDAEIEALKAEKVWGKPYWRSSLERRGLPITDRNLALSIVGSRLKERFLKQTPALKRLKADIDRAVDARGWLKAIDGRILMVRHKHAALNALLQSAGAIIMKLATCIAWETLDAPRVEQVLHIHDEVQFLTAPHDAEWVGTTMVSAIQAAGRELNFRCPLDGEWKAGASWAETH